MSNSKTVIDVSKYNIINDYATVAKYVDGMIIRCGYRSYREGKLTKDPLFETHIVNAKKAGIPIGVYFFTTAVNTIEARTEADFTVNLIKSYGPLSFPIFIDTEMSNNKHDGRSDKLSKAQRTENVIAFCERIKELGYTPGIYASDSWFVTQLDYNKIKQYKLWVASYSRSPYRVGTYIGWQYTSTAVVSGISGKVDMSHWYVTIGNPESEIKEKNPYLKPSINVRKGMKGEAVKWLQWELNEEGYKLKIDGDFGNKTLAAVKDYQKKKKLTVDGIVGPQTIAALIGQSSRAVGSNIFDTAAIYSASATMENDTRFEFMKGAEFIVTCANIYLTRFSIFPLAVVHGECEILDETLHNERLKVRVKRSDGKSYTGWFKWIDVYKLFN